jgi:hypothetical protein
MISMRLAPSASDAVLRSRRGRAARSGSGWLMRCVLVVAVAALAAGCGATSAPPPTPAPPAALSPWPSPGDYVTIKTAFAARDRALFHESDWRRRSFSAQLAGRTLLTVRMAPGRCARYVTELYGNLRDLMDAYPGEDWSTLVRFVRRQPSLADACVQPRGRLAV